MKQCRVIITTECNLQCPYCCNKIPEVQAQFKMKTLDEIISSDFDVYVITGGEPTIAKSKLIKLVKVLRYRKPNCKIYINTNAYDCSTIIHILDVIDGLNIGCHKDNVTESLALYNMMKLLKTSVRFHIQNDWREWIDKSLSKEIESIPNKKEWVMNECSVENEERCII